jgi:hypothetical protein
MLRSTQLHYQSVKWLDQYKRGIKHGKEERMQRIGAGIEPQQSGMPSRLLASEGLSS